MKRLVLACVSAGLLGLAGCGHILPNDPAVLARSEKWFRLTDPAVFFLQEQKHGRIYFLGVYDPGDGADSPAPGIDRNDPLYHGSRTWFIPADPTLDFERNRRYVASAREFARRYNPLVLAYLRQHPGAR